MIDLSFLTDEEQEAILKVLQRDASLKRAEEDRVRNLPEKIQDDSQIKNMSGQWFYEAKAKRHREKIHGADLIRASMRRKPLTTAESNRSKSSELKNSWVSNINKEATKPPQVFGAIEEKEEESKSSQSSKVFNATFDILDKPQEDPRKMASSPSKQRKNPFNDSALREDNELPENRMTDLSEASKKDTLLPSVESPSKLKFTNNHRVEEPQQAPVEPNDLQRQAGKPPIPKARKNIRKTSDVSLKSDDLFPKTPGRVKQINGQGTPPRGILKRSPSSSSTDSEVLRLSQTYDPPNKSVLEGVAEKSPPAGEVEGFSQNSLERLKQVRFSSNVGRKERPQSLELHEGKESGEFSFIDLDHVKTSENKVGELDALQSEQTLPAKLPHSHSPVLNGNTEEGGLSCERETASNPFSADRSDLPSSPLLREKRPIVEPTTPEKSSSKISPNASEKQTLDEAHPQVKTQQLSPGPDSSKNITGQQLLLAKTEDPHVPSPGSSNLEQGKPVLVEDQNAKTSSKYDKHAAEVIKAADESISKVLDWFQRSSSTDNTDTLSLVPQGRKSAEEADVPKMIEDNGSSRDMLNLHLFEKEKLATKDDQAHESINPPGKFSLAMNTSPGTQIPEEQRLYNGRKLKGVADSGDQGESVRGRERVYFQTSDQESHKKTAMGSQHNMLENVYRKQKDSKIQLGLKSVDSSTKVMEGKNSQKKFVDGEVEVKSFIEEENLGHQALKKPEEEKESRSLNEGTMADDTSTNREHLLLQPKVLKQPSQSRDQNRVKDIRAFWECAKATSKLPDCGEPVNDGTPVSNVMQSNAKISSPMKPLGGSSGYATAESDSEQGKYSLVTFKKVQLSDDDSESTENDITLTLGITRPSPVDKCKLSHIDNSSKQTPSDQLDIKSTKLLNTDNLRIRHSTGFPFQEDGGLQAVDMEKEQTPSARPQKPNFEIHSLKEQIDEESKGQRLDPSRFQSLRSFWDVGTRSPNDTEAAKTKRVIPSSNTYIGSSWKDSKELKGVPVGTDKGVLEGEQQNQIIREDRVKQPNSKMSPQREASRTIPKEVIQPVLSPTTKSVPVKNLELALKEDNSEEPGHSKVLPVEECFEKSVAPSKKQHGLFNSGLQKMMKEAYQESLSVNLPPNEEGTPKIEEEILYTDQNPQPAAVSADMDRSSKFPANEVVESVNRTWIQPKVDTDAFRARLGQLLKEAKPFSSHLIAEEASEQDISPSEKESMQKCVSSIDQPIEFKPGLGNLSREIDSNSTPGEASKGQIYPNDETSQKTTFQIPSPSPILPDAHLTVNQNRERYPGKEVSEVVTETSVPSKRECRNLNAKLLILLKESSRMPCISPATEKILKTSFHSIPGEDQQRSSMQMTPNSAPASSGMANCPRGTVSETIDRSVDASIDDVNMLSTVQGEPSGEVENMAQLRNQRDISDQSKQLKEKVVPVGEQSDQQPDEVAETVVKTVKPNSLEHIAFKNNLSKLLKEDYPLLSKDTEIPGLMHASLQPGQSEGLAFHKDIPSPQEIDEVVERATAPSNFRYSDLKANLEKLLKLDSVIQPPGQESADDIKEVHVRTEPNWTIDLASQEKISQGPEINETVIQNIAPSKLKGNEFNSRLRKLLEEASQVPSVQVNAKVKEKIQMSPDLEGLVLPQERNETVVKSVAPAKDVAAFKFSLGELMKESSDTSLQLSQESQKVFKDSIFLLEKKSLPEITPSPTESTSSSYRSEVKVPLRRNTSKRDEQAVEGKQIPVVPESNVAFQKILQVNLASTETPLLKKESSPILARVAAKENRYERKAEEVSNARMFLGDGSEEADVAMGPQRSSTPTTEKENTSKMNKVELWNTIHCAAAAGDEEDEDTKSFGSNISEENLDSFAGIQRSSACSEEESNPVLEALKRSSNRQIPSKSLENIPSATSSEQ